MNTQEDILPLPRRPTKAMLNAVFEAQERYRNSFPKSIADKAILHPADVYRVMVDNYLEGYKLG